MNEKRWLALILLLFILLGLTYALVTPPFEASDELWHYPMARHLADGNPLPVQVFDPELVGPWKQEASQPPLYYYLGAALTFWIDTSDMSEVRIENPHVDNGIITEDGNINLVMHEPGASSWEGTLLAVRIIRIFSVLLGAGTVALTYFIAREAGRGRAEIALGAAAVNAFLPMFLFISGSVNNDNLAIMLASLALLIMIRIIIQIPKTGPPSDSQPPQQESLWSEYGRWLLLGIVIGAGLLTKQGTIGLVPLAWGTAFAYAWQKDRTMNQDHKSSFASTLLWLVKLFLHSLAWFALVMLPALIIAGWWYWRNVELYGDVLGWSAFIAVLGQRAHPASLIQLWGERRGFLMAYWGLFGGVNVPMPSWVYTVFNILLLFSVMGFVVYFIRLLRSWFANVKGTWHSLRSWIDNLLLFIVDNFALVVCLLFATAVVIGLVRWATTTWSSQGRLVFTALSALSTLFVIGLIGWMPQRTARRPAAVISAFFFMVAILAPFLWIAPAYQADAYSPPEPYDLHSRETLFGDSIVLRSAAVDTGQAEQAALQPGDPIWVHLDWEFLEPADQNWSVFVHLIDPVLGQPIAQRDMYPGQGLLLTTSMEPGQRLVNSYLLNVPQTAVAPSQLQIAAGLYDYETGERLPAATGENLVDLANIPLIPAEGNLPNPQTISYENRLDLVGYEIAPRRVLPGDSIDLTLYWRANQELAEDYTFFTQIVDKDTTRWAGHDLAPAEGTSNWIPGEDQALSFTLILDENSKPGLYPLIVGAYTRANDGGFNRLQLVTSDGRLTDDFVELTRIRID